MREFTPDIDCAVHTLVPRKYAEHPLVRQQVWYILPTRLLDVLERIPQLAFDKELFRMERDLARKVSHDKYVVGYRDGEAFAYTHLTEEDTEFPVLNDEVLKIWNWTREEYEKVCKRARSHFSFVNAAQRGYIGWLMTNHEFLTERNGLFERWHSHVATHGIPQVVISRIGPLPDCYLAAVVTDPDTQHFLDDFAAFYARWRLRCLVTRELPEPLAPQTSMANPLQLLTYMSVGRVVLYQPDTMPVPSRDTLRMTLETTRVAQQHDDHLRDWKDVVATDRTNNQAIDRYGRAFILSHFWTVLQSRHSSTFKNNVKRIQDAFAEFMCKSPQAIEKARLLIAQGRRGQLK